MRRDAGDVQDRPPAGGSHLLAEDLAAPVHGVQVAGEYAVPVLVLGLEISARVIDPRAVDQHVDPALGGEDLAQEVRDRRALHHVDRRERRFAPGGLDLLDPHLAPLGVAAGDDDRRPGLRQPLRSAPPRTPVPPMTTAT